MRGRAGITVLGPIILAGNGQAIGYEHVPSTHAGKSWDHRAFIPDPCGKWASYLLKHIPSTHAGKSGDRQAFGPMTLTGYGQTVGCVQVPSTHAGKSGDRHSRKAFGPMTFTGNGQAGGCVQVPSTQAGNGGDGTVMDRGTPAGNAGPLVLLLLNGP